MLFAFLMTACDASDSGTSSEDEMTSDTSATDGENTTAGENTITGENTTGGDDATAGTSASTVPEGTLNELTDNQRVDFCEARLDKLTSTIDFESEQFQQTTDKSCLLGGLFEGADQASCEMLVDTCKAEAMMGLNSEDMIDECLANEELFSTCMATASDYLDCESAITLHTFDAFTMVDFGEVTCANAGDFTALSGLFGQLQSLLPPEGTCSPEAGMCIAPNEEEITSEE